MADTHDPQTEPNSIKRSLFWVVCLAVILVAGWHATGVAQCYTRGGSAELSLGGVTCQIPLPPESLSTTG